MRPPSRSSFIRSLIQAFSAHRIKRHISRRKKERRTARPRCLVDRALHRWAELAFQQHIALHLHQPPQHTTYLRLPPATLGKAQWHLPILTTEPRSASQLTVHEITLSKYCYCWSAVVVIPSNPAVSPQGNMIGINYVNCTYLVHIDTWIPYHTLSIKNKESELNNFRHKINYLYYKTIKYRWQIHCNEFLYVLQYKCSHM